MPKIRVFSSDNIELTPCNLDRAHSLTRKGKAYFSFTDNDEPIIIIRKSSEETFAEEEGDNE